MASSAKSVVRRHRAASSARRRVRAVLGAYDSATQTLRKYTVGLPSTIARSLIGNPGDVHSALAEIAEKYPVNRDDPKERVLMAQGVPSVYFEVSANGDRLRLRGIRSASGAEGSGLASLLLDRLVKIADRHRVVVELTASPYKSQRLDKEQLIRWYSRHGFRMEPGYDEALGYMIHEPRSKENPMPKISTKDPATMTAGEINKELDKIDALDRALTDEFIAAGRGHERPSDYWPPRPGDTLAAQSLALYDRASKLRYEIQREYGPGAPSRFPSGWRRSLMRRNPDPTPGELETSYEEHLELVTSPEFIEASPEEQAAMMTGLDMGEHGDREHGHDCGCDHDGAHPHWQEIAEQVVGNPRRNPNVTVAQAKDLFYRMGQQAGRGARVKPHYPTSDPKGVEARADITAQNFIETYRLAEARTNEIADQYIRGFYDAYKSKGRRNRRRNPAAAADRMFESFHGYPPDKTIEVEEEFHEHEYLAVLGKLVEFEVKTVTGYKAVIGFEPKMPWLTTNEDGTQLYVVGGNQSLDVKALHFTDADIKDHMVIGQLFGLVYRTRKDWHDGERDEEDTDYDHKVGEESGELPDLLYDPLSKKLSMAGGRYRIKMPSGQTSPGIED